MTAPIPTTPAAPVGQDPASQPPTPPAPQPVAQPGQAPVIPQQPYAPQPYQMPPQIPMPPAPSPGQAPDDGGRDLSALPQWARKQIEDLRTENASRRVAARTAVVNQHAFVAASQLGVNGHALLKSTDFQAIASQLDPQAADFGQQLSARISELLATSPWMAASQAPTSQNQPPPMSGAEFAGGNPAGVPITEAQLAAMTPDQIAEAMRDGKLQHLL